MQTDDSKPILINRWLRSQESHRCIDVIDNFPITEPRSACNDIVGTFGAIAVVEIRRSGDVAGLC
jgi:hypothetical protein